MSSTRRPAKLLLLLASLAAAGHVRAQNADADAGQWMLMLAGLRDEDAYEHTLASFHLGITAQSWLSLTAGTSRAPSTEADVEADLIAAGIEHDFGPVGIAFDLEDWGDDGNLESRDWRGELFLSNDRYRVAFVYEQRDIDIFFSGTGAPRLTDLRKVNIDADGFGLSGRYRLAPDWQIYGFWMEYDYPRRIRVVPRADRISLLSASAATLAYSLVDQYASLGIERAFGNTLLNVDVGHDRSTIDDRQLSSLSASVLFAVAPRFDLEFQIGSSRADGSDALLYGGLTLLIYGGG